MATTGVEGKVAGGHRGNTSVYVPPGPPHAAWCESISVDRERRPVDYSYVITQGTFLIGNWGNNLIADSHVM